MILIVIKARMLTCETVYVMYVANVGKIVHQYK